MRAAIPGSTLVAGLALAASLGAHLSGLWLRPPESVARIEGGGGAELAAQGMALANLAAGTDQPVTAKRAERPAPTAAVTPVPAETTPRAAPVPGATEAIAPDGVSPATAQGGTAPVPTRAPQPSIAPPPVADPVASAPTVALSSTAVPQAPGSAPIAAARPGEAASAPAARAATAPVPAQPDAADAAVATDPGPTRAVTPEQTVEALPEDDNVRISPRPPGRSAEIEARAAEIEATRRRQATAEAERRAEARQSQTAPSRGNAQANARRGAASDSDGRAASSGSGRQQAAGNAAASNYPGQVFQRIARQRLPRGIPRGVARVTFSIAPGGALSGARLSGSSGDARLDAAAMNIVRRAAPFPAPPPGAQRNFTIPIRAR